ncbi:MAG: hypothetical protein AAGH48_11555 [Pseudomonadota bacterium]
MLVLGTALSLSAAAAAEPGRAQGPEAVAGGIAYGAAYNGVTDRVYAMGPPNWSYVVRRRPGSFLDCGRGSETKAHDAYGQSTLSVSCGVTLTETLAIPQVGPKARIAIHY